MNDLDLKEVVLILHERLKGLENGNSSLIPGDQMIKQDAFIEQVLNSIRSGE